TRLREFKGSKPHRLHAARGADLIPEDEANSSLPRRVGPFSQRIPIFFIPQMEGRAAEKLR
ncbi:MAG: hypothetical protein KHZ47_07650, partial [Rothia mucilaginosa]|nr:hypothetical protein [Rothia mucilaginosa]